VVDSLGVTHVLTYTFAKTGPNAWSYDVSIPGEDLTGGTAGTPTSLASGSLAFDAAGNLTTPPAGTPVNVKTTTGLVSGANDLDMNWSLYAPDGTSLVTQFAQTSAASATTQDGVQAAQLTGIKLGDGGTLMATFSSGKQVAIAQIALAAIGNPDSLISVGNNNFQVGTNTLTPTVGLPNTGNRGTILGGSLESSNVDLAREFTNLIIYQRGYQANAKVITSQDQIDQVLLNIKQ
jgi:flagellar hook protein FlgE